MKEEVIRRREFIPLCYDMVFKKVFGDQNNLEPLQTLLKVVLNIDAKEITILNSEILGKTVYSKKTAVDLVVKLKDGTRIGIEMNRSASDSSMERNIIYMFRLMANNLKHNEIYSNLDRFIQLNFDMDGTHVDPIDQYMLANLKNPKMKLTEKLQIYRIDVPYFTRKCYNEEGKELNYKEKFIGLIGALSKEQITKIVGGDRVMSDIKKRVELCNDDKDVLEAYDYEYHVREQARLAAEYEIEKEYKPRLEREITEKVTKDVTEKVTKDVTEKVTKDVTEKVTMEVTEKIEKDLKNEIVMKMLKEGADIDFISKITGLSNDKIVSIRNQN